MTESCKESPAAMQSHDSSVKDSKIKDIINLCLKIDTTAERAYKELAAITEPGELREFWLVMSKEEKHHIELWQKFKQLIQDSSLEQLFENPDQVIAELEEIVPKAQELVARSKENRDKASCIVVAYRLEFYLLHPALVQIFHIIDSFDSNENSVDEYEGHISRFIEVMERHGQDTPEMELLSESLNRLWYENKNLALKASTDSLTNIHNRRGFFSIATLLASLASRNQYTSGVIMADLDNFKDINDTYGHQSGDAVLAQVAGIIKSNCRISDIVGRYGGEEFCVFMPDAQQETVREVAERIRFMVEETRPAGHDVTISIGIAHSMIDTRVEESLQTLIYNADQNLLVAKKEGRNRVVC
jgi:diguanylate cyclase (GGDEF)-like protein